MCPLQTYPSVRTLLDRYGLAAKKSWGQNFLHAESVFSAIVNATVTSPDDWAVEIGAGIGTLTARLANKAARVVAVERDRDMVGVLQGELGQVEQVTIAEANALTFDYRAVAAERGGPIAICGNLPYNISSQILFALLEVRDVMSRGVVMLQREVADRLVAAPGSKTYGALTVMIGAYCDLSMVTRVSAGSFTPRPKVESAVVRMVPRPGAQTPPGFSEVVHAAFGQRRKTLRNALRAVFPVERVDAALAATRIDGGRRGETLTVQEYCELAEQIAG